VPLTGIISFSDVSLDQR